MTMEATGKFEVKLTPVDVGGGPIGTMSIDKTFYGDLDGSSLGHMLAFRTSVEGSAGYVAMERVTGALAGKKGAFTLQHSGSMDRGRPSLVITVVPDSGTDELEGLRGTMSITVNAGQHEYRFAYALPPK